MQKSPSLTNENVMKGNIHNRTSPSCHTVLPMALKNLPSQRQTQRPRSQPLASAGRSSTRI